MGANLHLYRHKGHNTLAKAQRDIMPNVYAACTVVHRAPGIARTVTGQQYQTTATTQDTKRIIMYCQ